MGYFDSTDGFSVNDTVVVDGGRNISAVGATFTGTVVGGTFSGNISSSNVVNSFNGSTGTVTYSPRLATSSLTGVASFGNEFNVSAAGAVSLTANYVKTFNGLTGAVSYAPPLANGSVTGVASFGNEFVVSSGAVSLTSNYVKTVNGVTGAVTIAQGSNVTVSTVGNTITIASSGVGGGSSPPLATSSVTGVASFGNEFVVSALGAVSLTANYVKTFNGATGTVVYAPPLATTGVTGVAQFDGTDFAVSATGSVTIADTALNSGGLITQKNASGTSSSGTAGTVIATLTAASGRMFIAWQVVAAQVSAANTQLTVTITYSDATTAALTTTVSTASTVFGNVGGLHRTTAGAAPTSNNIVTIDATKKVTKIEVTTAGSGTSLRAATIGVLEVGQ